MEERDNSLFKRWFVLFLSTVAMLGNTYVYDNPSALHDQLFDKFSVEPVNMQSAQFEYNFNMLYTVYSLPNILLPILGGVLVDGFGASRMVFIFAVLVVFGQLIVSLGVSAQSMFLMLVGRTIFGIGGESMCVGSTAILKEWFSGKEFAMAMGTTLSISRFGSVINNILSPHLAERFGVVTPFWFGTLVCFLSVLAALILLKFDEQSNQSILKNFEKINMSKRLHGAMKFQGFGFSFWLLVLSCVVMYGCVLPFNNVASPLLIHKYYCDGDCCPPNQPQCDAQLKAQQKAALVMSIPYTVSAVLAPVIGAFVDWVGFKAVIMLVASFLIFYAHMMLGLSTIQPVFPLVLLGIGYAIYTAAIWPAIPDVVADDRKGLAFGLVTAVQNAGLALIPLLVAMLRSHTHTYEPIEVFFALLAGFGIASGLVLNYDDIKRSSRLNGPKFKELFGDYLKRFSDARGSNGIKEIKSSKFANPELTGPSGKLLVG
eukprot:g5548.t1